jgi:hypothetical protein
VFVVLITAIALGFFLGQWLVLTALSGRLDMIERILLEQGSRCGGAEVVAVPIQRSAPAATATATPTAEPAAAASAAPTGKPAKDLSF